MYYGWGFWGMSFIWWIFWVLLIIGFFVVATPVPRSRAREWLDPLEVLRRRYANGEMTTAEFEERKATLLRDRENPREPRPPAKVPPTTTTPTTPPLPQT